MDVMILFEFGLDIVIVARYFIIVLARGGLEGFGYRTRRADLITNRLLGTTRPSRTSNQR